MGVPRVGSGVEGATWFTRSAGDAVVVVAPGVVGGGVVVVRGRVQLAAASSWRS